MSDVTVISLANLRNEVRYGAGHVLITDEPTVLYARRKAWPVERVTVRLRQQRIHGEDCQECEQKTDGFVHRIERSVSFQGALTEEQLTRLQEIAHKCPVQKTLTAPIIVTEMKDESVGGI